jgi:hypothetical protein
MASGTAQVAAHSVFWGSGRISFTPCRNSGRLGPGGYTKDWVDTEFSKQISSPHIPHPESILSNPVRPLSTDEGRKQGICCRVGIDSLIDNDKETVENNNNISIKDQEKITRKDNLQAQMRFSKEKSRRKGHGPEVKKRTTSVKLRKDKRQEVQKRITRSKDLQTTPKNQK